MSMLPPNPNPQSRQASYAHGRVSRQPSGLVFASPVDAEDEDEDEETFENRLRMEEEEDGQADDARGLEETLEKLGFGAYHWRLLALCGFGWMSDNSSLQCIAVILPRVQIHYNLSAEVVGLLSASTMAGMMIGAVGWGVVSDLLGRALPFNSTLFLTAVFGIGASFAPSFPFLCFWMFLLGSAVGGSMPTDGTLFLENLPHSKQYLLTLLSVFFSLGAVLSSVVSYIFLPGASCRQFEGCDIEGKANEGWRRVLLVLGLVNLGCAIARWSLFRLQESPRYLVSNGRSGEAVVALQHIAKFNDQSLEIDHADVRQTEPSHATDVEHGGAAEDGETKYLAVDMEEQQASLHRRSNEGSPVPPYTAALDDPSAVSTPHSGSSRTMYDSVGIGPAPPPRKQPLRLGSAFYSVAAEEHGNTFDQSFGEAAANGVDGRDEGVSAARKPNAKRTTSMLSVRSIGEATARGAEWWIMWKRQMGKLFVPKWRKTVILMWIIWGSMSLSYTMFNVWLPAVLESRASGEGDEAIKEALKEFVLYSVAGCPGSIVGAWMIQTPLGRRKSLAICTLATALSTFAFIKVSAKWAVTISSMTISAAATAMYAVLYGMTPETFGTSIRGTACGTSAALSRFTGVLAPVSAGFLLSISPSLPVFVAAGILMITATCSLLLPFERVAAGKGGAVMAH